MTFQQFAPKYLDPANPRNPATNKPWTPEEAVADSGLDANVVAGFFAFAQRYAYNLFMQGISPTLARMVKQYELDNPPEGKHVVTTPFGSFLAPNAHPDDFVSELKALMQKYGY